MLDLCLELIGQLHAKDRPSYEVYRPSSSVDMIAMAQ